MPTYEYVCKDCDDEFEVFQRMSEDRLKECKKCGGQLKRLIGTGAGIIFKGSGFYETDFKDKKGKKPTEKPADKTEAKPEKKESTKSTATDKK